MGRRPRRSYCATDCWDSRSNWCPAKYLVEIVYFKNAPGTLRTLFADARSDAPFIVYDKERMSLPRPTPPQHALLRLVRDWHERGDRVAISMRNYPEWILSFMAVTAIGDIAVAMNALWRPDEMAFGLSDSGAKVLIADQERLDRFAAIEQPLDIQVMLAARTTGIQI